MDIMALISKVWNNKRLRDILILGVLILLLAVIIIHWISNIEEPPAPGAKRAVICSQCKKTLIQRVYRIKETACSNCKANGTLHYAWKCGKCQYEYYPNPYEFKTKALNTMQRFQKVAETRMCPNCSETKDISPMSIQDVK